MQEKHKQTHIESQERMFQCNQYQLFERVHCSIEVSSDVGQQSLPVPSFTPASSQIVGYQSAVPVDSHTVCVSIPSSSNDLNTLALFSSKKHIVLSAILFGVDIYVH